MTIEEIEKLVAEFGYSVADYEHRKKVGIEQSFIFMNNARIRLLKAIKQYKEQK